MCIRDQLLYRGLRVPVSLHRASRDLPPGPPVRRHAGAPVRRDGAADVGAIHGRVGSTPAVAVLQGMGLGGNRRDAVRPPRAPCRRLLSGLSSSTDHGGTPSLKNPIVFALLAGVSAATWTICLKLGSSRILSLIHISEPTRLLS